MDEFERADPEFVTLVGVGGGVFGDRSRRVMHYDVTINFFFNSSLDYIHCRLHPYPLFFEYSSNIMY